MKQSNKFLVALIAISFALTMGLQAKKPRKLSVGAYISGAKIAYGESTISGDSNTRPRYEDALALVDSCLMWYGPVPDAYYWRARVLNDLADEAKHDTAKHLALLDSLVIAADSLKWSCEKENKEVKKKYKKKCDEMIPFIDTLLLGWFGVYYDEAQEARKTITDDLEPSLAEALTEDEKAEIQAEIDELYEKAIKFYKMAGHIYPQRLGYLVNLGEVYIKLGKYDEAIPYLLQAVDESKDAADQAFYINLLIRVGFSYFDMKQFDSAAVFFKKALAELHDDELDFKKQTISNIIAAYGNAGNRDSMHVYYHKLLELDPNSVNALRAIGIHWFQRIVDLNGKMNEARQAEDKAAIEKLEAEITAAADSSMTYTKRAIELKSDDIDAIQLYARASFVKGDLDASAEGWRKLTEQQPDNFDAWYNLGDILIQSKKLTEAIEPFEKASEINPDDINVWRNLADLYAGQGMNEKAAKALAKVKELEG